jgi:hypothetical protein
MYLAVSYRALRLTVLCSCLLPGLLPQALAGDLLSEDGPVGVIAPPPENQEWQELVVTLPPYPEASRLLELDIDTGATPYRHYLDPESLSVGADRVARFTTVIVSPSGVWNVTYEGLHCGEKTHRRLAYGFGGKWHLLPGTDWERITGSGTQRYRKTLYEKFICPATEPARDPEQILRRLRASRPAAGD